MAGAFDHHLTALVPSDLGEFAERLEFADITMDNQALLILGLLSNFAPTGTVVIQGDTNAANAGVAFGSVESIMRDVNAGWFLRYAHANGASMFFIAVYIHMFRGMYYGSYKAPREVLWMIGVLIYLVMMATAFLEGLGLRGDIGQIDVDLAAGVSSGYVVLLGLFMLRRFQAGAWKAMRVIEAAPAEATPGGT